MYRKISRSSPGPERSGLRGQERINATPTNRKSKVDRVEKKGAILILKVDGIPQLLQAKKVTKLSVILPICNEEGNLPRIQAELVPILDRITLDWEIIAVDDGSKDESLRLLRKLATQEPRLQVRVHDKNLGLGQALRTGIAATQAEWVVTLDADFTFHPEVIEKLLSKQKETDADCVIGSPLLEKGNLVDVPFHRALLTHASNWVYQLVLGTKVTSITAICRLYRKQDLHSLELTSDGFQINAEILARLLRNGRKIVEIPATLSTRTIGESKMQTGKEIGRHLALLWFLFQLRRSKVESSG